MYRYMRRKRDIQVAVVPIWLVRFDALVYHSCIVAMIGIDW